MSTPTSPPASPEAGSDRSALVRAVAEQHRDQRGPLLPVLHEVMAEFGHVDAADVPVIADVLNLSAAEVHGVVSFYHDFRRTPPPPHHVAVCRAEACQARGAEETWAAAGERWGEAPEVGVSEVFCLGNCALGPSAMLDGALHGRVTPERLAQLTEGWS